MGRFGSNSEAHQPDQEVSAYVASNGLHSGPAMVGGHYRAVSSRLARRTSWGVSAAAPAPSFTSRLGCGTAIGFTSTGITPRSVIASSWATLGRHVHHPICDEWSAIFYLDHSRLTGCQIDHAWRRAEW